MTDIKTIIENNEATMRKGAELMFARYILRELTSGDPFDIDDVINTALDMGLVDWNGSQCVSIEYGPVEA
jgi:hypothetical protein